MNKHNEGIDSTNIDDEVLNYCERQILNSRCGRSAVDMASAYLMSRILELSRAATVLYKSEISSPVAIASLARAHMESLISMMEILQTNSSPAEMEDRAEYYLKFGDYKHVEFIGQDLQVYRSTLSDVAKANLDRRIVLHGEIRTSFSTEQRKQGKYPTWNGKSISSTICARLGENALDFYRCMCLIVHGDSAMMHKSITIKDDCIMLCQEDHGRSDEAFWILQMHKHLFVGIGFFQARHGLHEIDAEGVRIGKQLGLTFPE